MSFHGKTKRSVYSGSFHLMRYVHPGIEKSGRCHQDGRRAVGATYVFRQASRLEGA